MTFSRIKYRIFRQYKRDLFGGITAAVVALPLALAFGVQSGMGAIAGLYGAIFLGFFAALTGGTKSQISGPTAPMTAVSMVIIAGIVQVHEGNLQAALPHILCVFLLAGLFQICLGVLSLGTYIKYIPYPVISGFMTGIGVIILVSQLLPAIGYYPEHDQAFLELFKPAAEEVILEDILRDEANHDLLVLENFKETITRAKNITTDQIILEEEALAKKATSGVWNTLMTLPRAIDNFNPWAIFLCMLTIGLIYAFKKITSSVPSTLIALIIVSLIAVIFNLPVEKIGHIPSKFPSFRYDIITQFRVSQISPYVLSALSLAVLGAIDSLLTSVVVDNITKEKHNSNQELIGQGIGNSVAAFFGGIPGAGATVRTLVNLKSGGSTKLSGMIAAVFILVVILLLGDYAAQIPRAVLAGILITVGISVMDYKGLKALKSIPLSDVLVMVVVLLSTIFWDLIYAVGLGLVIASLIFMKKMGDSAAAVSNVIKLCDDDQPIDNPDYTKIPDFLKQEIFIKELKGPLFFGYTSDFTAMSTDIPDYASHAIIRMDEVPFMDQSGLFAMEDVFQGLLSRGIQPLLVGLQDQPSYRLETIKIIPDLIDPEYIFDDYDDCITWILLHVKDTVA